MHIIKLNAIDSTNDYLKQLCKRGEVENGTVVYAETQYQGRGQTGSVWVTEPGKNLTMSMLIRDTVAADDSMFTLNVAVAVSILAVLQELQIPNLSIKWPNDIMSDKKKVGGILIENTIDSHSSLTSVVGIGINTNQQRFENLPQASSLINLTGEEYDRFRLAMQIATRIEAACEEIRSGNSERYWESYRMLLFKKDVPMPFESGSARFMGIIRDVSANGRLQLELEDEQVGDYGIRDLKMLY